jgi:hypothetical protein
MPDIPTTHDHVLAIHPTSRGFGWALFEAPDALLDWGLVHSAYRKRGDLVTRLRRILSHYQPSVLVLEEYADDASERTGRIQALNLAFEQVAAEHGVSMAVYDRELVASVLGVPSRASRYDVACAVANRIEDLSHRMPPKRKFGNSEDARQSLFAAAALSMTRYAVMGLD